MRSDISSLRGGQGAAATGPAPPRLRMPTIKQAMTAIQETWVQSLGQEDPLEEEMATHSMH